MFSTWDLVRPPMWHPMSALELSLMDDDELLLPLLSLSMAPLTSMMLPATTADEEFFKDLPVGQAGTANTEGNTARGLSSYSFTQSMVRDAQGRAIASTRRRYEDSTGRLKAVHEREIDGRRLVTTWNRQNQQDKGEHHSIASEGTEEDFEKVWAETPFGKAHKQKQLEHKQQHQQQEGGESAASSANQPIKSSYKTAAAQPQQAEAPATAGP